MPNVNFALPYVGQSPTLYKRIEYNTEQDIMDEIERILAEPGTQKFGVGQSLYYQLPLFCDTEYVIPGWCWDMLDDYQTCKRFNLPLGKNLDDVSAWRTDCFNLIENEIQKITEYEKKKNG